jgi:hypothetical protein
MSGNKNSGRKPLPIKNVNISVSITPALKAKIQKAAKGDGRSMVDWIRWTLTKTLA